MPYNNEYNQHIAQEMGSIYNNHVAYEQLTNDNVHPNDITGDGTQGRPHEGRQRLRRGDPP